MKESRLIQLQDTLGYRFGNGQLLKNALTHSSYANERHWRYPRNNERLEYLGDAVLELVSSEYIYSENPDMEEGEMSKLRASLVCEMSLASSAREIHLGDFLYLGKGEDSTGGRKRDSILSDAFEAVIGAIYLDGGIEQARAFIRKYVLSDLEKKHLFYDSKTILQEMVQGRIQADTCITYPLRRESGPDHDKVFEVVCCINDVEYGHGTGHSKKAAQQKAAYETILLLKQEN